MKKRTYRKTLLIFILVGIVLFLILGIKVYKDFMIDSSPNKQISYIDIYGYSLAKNDTDLYKVKFKELKSVLDTNPIDYNNYAKLISELFVIDVFTLDNKLASTDIGGLEFLHKDLKENFQENMGYSLYKFVESNLDGKREQELPIVKEIKESSIFETKYTYNDKEYDAYLVTVSWDYEVDMKYQNKIKLTLIKDNNKLFIVKGEK